MFTPHFPLSVNLSFISRIHCMGLFLFQMVLGYTVNHLFQHPVEKVVNAHLESHKERGDIVDVKQVEHQNGSNINLLYQQTKGMFL